MSDTKIKESEERPTATLDAIHLKTLLDMCIYGLQCRKIDAVIEALVAVREQLPDLLQRFHGDATVADRGHRRRKNRPRKRPKNKSIAANDLPKDGDAKIDKTQNEIYGK